MDLSYKFLIRYIVTNIIKGNLSKVMSGRYKAIKGARRPPRRPANEHKPRPVVLTTAGYISTVWI